MLTSQLLIAGPRSPAPFMPSATASSFELSLLQYASRTSGSTGNSISLPVATFSKYKREP